MLFSKNSSLLKKSIKVIFKVLHILNILYKLGLLTFSDNISCNVESAIADNSAIC